MQQKVSHSYRACQEGIEANGINQVLNEAAKVLTLRLKRG